MATTFDIKRDGVTIKTIRPQSAPIKRAIMGENTLNLTFKTSTYFAFEVGDTVDAEGETFTLNQLPGYQKLNSRSHNYTMVLEGSKYQLDKTLFMMFDSNNELQDADFSLMGNAATFINLIVRNMNRNDAGWTTGDIDDTTYQNLTFSKESCLGALSTLADTYKTEYWIIGKTIHFTKKGGDSGLSASYGKDNGLLNISRKNVDSANICTRLYAFGSEKNIPYNYRNYANRLRIPLTANGGQIYIEQNVAQYGVIEHCETFDDVYPHRVGTVTAIDAANPLKFTDADLDFDVNAQSLPDVKAKVVWLTGLLAGYECEISDYNSVTKEFTLNVNTDEKAAQIPGDVFKPAVGDTYTLVNLLMPQTYVDAAEADLLVKAQDYLAKNSTSRVIYSGVFDPIKYRRDGINLSIGDTIHVVDADLGVDANIRMASITIDALGFSAPVVELNEEVKLSRTVRNYISYQKTQTAIKLNNLLDPAAARRRWRDTQELLNLVFDTDGYFTDKIRPLSIETSMLAVGARSQQFELNGFIAEPNYQGDVNHFISSAASLDHFTIDPDNIITWNLASSNYSALTTGNAYYIYAKCEKAGANGSILLTTAQITVNEDASYYHFLLGVLHSTSDTNTPRGISLTYGQTTINGKFIKTGRVTSSDGLGYIDLDQNQFNFGDANSGIDWNVTTPNQLTVRGHIEATSGTIAGVNITANDLFTLSGSKVWIDPAVGIRTSGVLGIPSVQPDVADMETGQFYLFVDDTGYAGTAPSIITNLGDLLDVDATGRANGYVLYWNDTTAKYQFKAADFATSSTVYTKTEINNFLGGVTAITGYNKSNWDAAYGWGNHASVGYALSDGSNASGTWGIDISGTANNSTQWNGYNFDNASAYNSGFDFIFGRTSGVGEVRLITSTAVKSWLGLGSNAYTSTDYFHYETFTADANTLLGNRSAFTYSVNAPYTGPIQYFDAAGYGLQLNAQYHSGGYYLAFRTRNGDSSTWNGWLRVLTTLDQNETLQSVTDRGKYTTNDIRSGGFIDAGYNRALRLYDGTNFTGGLGSSLWGGGTGMVLYSTGDLSFIASEGQVGVWTTNGLNVGYISHQGYQLAVNGTGYFASSLYVSGSGSLGAGNGIFANGTDITAARSATSGVIYLGYDGNHYLYYDGSGNYYLPSGALLCDSAIFNYTVQANGNFNANHDLQFLNAGYGILSPDGNRLAAFSNGLIDIAGKLTAQQVKSTRLVIPQGEPAAADMETGEYYMYIG